MLKIKVLNFGYKNLPFRAHENDAGADVRVCFHNGEEGMWIEPNTSYKIPLGLGLILPDGYMACVYPRSGLSSSGLVCELPPIDSGYRGEIHAIVTNCGKTPRYINNGDRIGQLVITPVVIADFITDDIKDRGDNGFGSTGI